MIWYNGYIRFGQKEVQDFDEEGNPIANDGADLSDFIPCGYEGTSTLTAQSGENSPFVAQSYKVRIKLQPATERLKLYAKNKSLIGDFVVQSISDFDYIDETHLQCSR